MTLKTNLTTTDISLQRLSPESRTIVVMSDTTVARLSNIAEQRWGLLTTAQATEAGVSRNQLSRMAANGVLERVSQGVYRMAGAPRQENEVIYAASRPASPQHRRMASETSSSALTSSCPPAGEPACPRSG
jgi:predicted transcriptional regulator of viral defense system